MADLYLILMGAVGTGILIFWIVWATRMLEATERMKYLLEYMTDQIDKENEQG